MKELLIKNTVFYAIVPALRNLVAFLTLPIMTSYLTLSDYGKIALISMICLSFGSFLTLGIIDASVRFFFKYKDNSESLGDMYSSYVMFILTMTVIGAFILYGTYPILTEYIFKEDISFIWVIIFFLQCMLSYFNIINQYVFQNRHEGKYWALNEIMAFMFQIAITLILVIGEIFTFEAVIIGMAASEIIKMFVILRNLPIQYKIKFDGAYLKEAINYSWPMLPTLLIDIGYRTFDKTLVNINKGISQVGILDMSGRFSTIQKMTMDSVSGVISPLTMDLLTKDTEESKALLAKVFLKMSAALLLFSLIIMLFAQEMVYLLTTKDFHPVIYVVPILIYYHIFGILGMISYWLIRYPGKTYWIIPVQVIFISSNIILNLMLIPVWGVMGAALASGLSALISQTIQFIIGIKLLPIPLDISRLSAIFGMIIVETAALYGLYFLDLDLILNVCAKILLIFLFIWFISILKITSATEIFNYIRIFSAQIAGFQKRFA